MQVEDDVYLDDYLRVGGSTKLVGSVGIRRDPGTGAALSVKVTSNMWGFFIEQGGLIVVGDTSLPALPGGSGYTLVLDTYDRIRKQTSTIRYKHRVAGLAASDDATLSLRPVSFKWNSTGEADIGLIAEEVAKVLPDLVIYDNDGRPDGVKYDRTGVYLLQVVKAQEAQIATQESRLTAMERELAELKTAIRQLQSAGK